MQTSVLFFVLVACGWAAANAELYHYEFPELPCEWTFVQDYYYDELKGEYHDTKYVNDHYMKEVFDQKSSGQDYSGASVARPDLGNDTKFVKVFTHTPERPNETEQVSLDDLKYHYQPLSPKDGPFVFDFEVKENSTFHGVACVKYSNTTGDDMALYVDLEGYPIGCEGSGVESCNFTFIKSASLSEFVFDKGVMFEDERIYTAPTETRCNTTSSSSSKPAFVHYELPELPCEWTFVQDYVSKDFEYHDWKYANDKFLMEMFHEKGNNKTHEGEEIVRPDLGETINGTAFVKTFLHTNEHPNETSLKKLDDLKYYYQPLITFLNESRFSFDFEHVEDSNYSGQKCKKYFNTTGKKVALYVDSDGFPIGAETKDFDTVSFTFVRNAPLNVFAFNETVPFEDTRIYTAPTESTCPEPQSSMSSTVGVSSLIVAMIMAFFLAH